VRIKENIQALPFLSNRISSPKRSSFRKVDIYLCHMRTFFTFGIEKQGFTGIKKARDCSPALDVFTTE